MMSFCLLFFFPFYINFLRTSTLFCSWRLWLAHGKHTLIFVEWMSETGKRKNEKCRMCCGREDVPPRSPLWEGRLVAHSLELWSLPESSQVQTRKLFAKIMPFCGWFKDSDWLTQKFFKKALPFGHFGTWGTLWWTISIPEFPEVLVEAAGPHHSEVSALVDPMFSPSPPGIDPKDTLW